MLLVKGAPENNEAQAGAYVCCNHGLNKTHLLAKL